jgi:hypothetical protein
MNKKYYLSHLSPGLGGVESLAGREGVDRRPPSCRSYRGYVSRENTTLDMFRIYEYFNLVTY